MGMRRLLVGRSLNATIYGRWPRNAVPALYRAKTNRAMSDLGFFQIS